MDDEVAKFSKQKGKVTIKKKVLKEHFSKRREEKEKKNTVGDPTMKKMERKKQEIGTARK